MRILTTLVTFLLLTSGAMAHPCDDGTAPDGWLRDGGYCELRGNLASTVQVQKTVCFDHDPEPSVNDECPPTF